jgi:hypothetical protein
MRDRREAVFLVPLEDRLVVTGERLFEPLQIRQGIAAIAKGFGIGRLHGDGFIKAFQSLPGALQCPQSDAPIVVSLGVIRRNQAP